MTCQDVLAVIEAMAPLNTAEEWDNPGLLIGNAEDAVSRVLVALDITPGAAETAIAMGADLIITHHPVIFSPLKALDSRSLPYRLAAAGIAVISAHTNLDKAPGGVNDVLAEALMLTDVRMLSDGMCRIGRLPEVMTDKAFAKAAAETLNTAVRVNATGKKILTVAVCGGSGGDFIPAVAPVADAFVTGEVRHHEWLAANELGLTVIEAGHYATETPVTAALAFNVKEAFPALPVTVYEDGDPYETVK